MCTMFLGLHVAHKVTCLCMCLFLSIDIILEMIGCSESGLGFLAHGLSYKEPVVAIKGPFCIIFS